MKQVTKERITKMLAKAKVQHDKDERKTMACAKKGNWEYTPRAFTPSIKYFTRLNVFKTRNNIFDPSEMTAYSYGWWRYLQIIKGKLVFNNYSYSQQTNRHQGSLSRLLKELGVKIDHTVYIHGGLQDLFIGALPAEYSSIFDNEIAISRGRDGSWAQRYRRDSIKASQKQIKILRALGAKLSRKSIKAIKDKIYGAEDARLKAVASRKAFVKTAIKNTALFNLNEGVGA
jgi:hypothetical protein